ncbi:hypothetical protein [Actinocrispum wychmicini]|uniref:Secreted protein n=1 Tax=Actinocrispum wychmicini TaxID=1213861 RepID=A0A4R2JYV6_9PSEU|nr:hypothetical protein [Actinocrispum wychmicini]TCO65114.1 hypothetical protein EV192_101899 [Actinocrispum wychmicini]
MGAPVSAPPAPRGEVVRRLTRSARTAPGRLEIIASALVVLSVLTGIVASLAWQSKLDTISGLADHREPLSAAAQQIYRSLSDADATAASAFLSGGSEPAQLRDRYQVDVAQAGAALAKAASDVTDDSGAAQVAVLNKQLPVYTGLVETARSNNRLGLPIGAAYLREASTLMRGKLLKAAQELYAIDTDRLTAEQDSATNFPWLTVALTVVLLAALVATQMYLTRRTNRLLNVGLLVASIAVGLGLVWGVVAGWVSATAVDNARDDGTRQVDTLVQARIIALQARADETLTLVAHGDGAGYEPDFKALTPKLTDLLRKAQSDQAVANTTAWLDIHKNIRVLDDSGQYDQAVKLAIGTDDKGAAAAFGKLDDTLSASIQRGREKFVESTSTARNALFGIVPGVALLALLTAGGILTGIRQRLREYR